MTINPYEILKAKLKGKSTQQLTLQFEIDALQVERLIATAVEEITNNCRLTLQQQRQIELERLDKLTLEMEQILEHESSDVYDDENRRLLRDGVRTKFGAADRLLAISRQRAALLKLDQLEESVKNNAALYFEQLKTMDDDADLSNDELIERTRKLQGI